MFRALPVGAAPLDPLDANGRQMPVPANCPAERPVAAPTEQDSFQGDCKERLASAVSPLQGVCSGGGCCRWLRGVAGAQDR